VDISLGDVGEDRKVSIMNFFFVFARGLHLLKS